MKKRKQKNLLCQEIEDKLRSKIIAELATGKKQIIPVVTYSYCNTENSSANAFPCRGIKFIAGSASDAVTVNINPTISTEILINALLKIIGAITRNKRIWAEEVSTAIEKVATED
jgi:hypothetical protein